MKTLRLIGLIKKHSLDPIGVHPRKGQNKMSLLPNIVEVQNNVGLPLSWGVRIS